MLPGFVCVPWKWMLAVLEPWKQLGYLSSIAPPACRIDAGGFVAALAVEVLAVREIGQIDLVEEAELHEIADARAKRRTGQRTRRTPSLAVRRNRAPVL